MFDTDDIVFYKGCNCKIDHYCGFGAIERNNKRMPSLALLQFSLFDQDSAALCSFYLLERQKET